MASLLLTEEQTMLRDSARQFLAEQAPVAKLRELREQRDGDGFSRDLWRRFAEMGFTGILVPEAHGGLGLGAVEAGVVMEEIGRHLSVAPFFASSIVAVSLVLRAGTAAQQAALLRGLADGTRIAALAVDERSKHAPHQVSLKAGRKGDGWVLDGAKTFVEFGHAADDLVVAARTSGAADEATGITLFLVPRDVAGLAVERVAMVDAQAGARLVLRQVALPSTAVLGPVDGGSAALDAALDIGRACAAAELLGVAEESFARTLAYLKERRQFDRVIGEFQGLQHRAAALYVDIALARAAVAHALGSLASGAAQASGAASVAKSRAGRTATLAVQEGVQMHGGMGMTDEFEMGFFMKRARVLQERFGDSNFHADRLAAQREY